jgi:hypothetical protein
MQNSSFTLLMTFTILREQNLSPMWPARQKQLPANALEQGRATDFVRGPSYVSRGQEFSQKV